MKAMKILSALLVVGAMVLAGCGGDDDSAGSASSPAGNGVDRGFVAGMVPHHESAVEMAKIAQGRGESAFVKQLAEDIVRTQNEEIELMRTEDQKLAEAGIKPGSLGVPEHMTGMEGDPAMLRTANPFDRAFINMMIPHHEGAVTMARAELDRGKDPELKKLAQNIITTQQREIREMKNHLGSDGTGGMTDGGGEHGGGHSG